MRTLRNAITQNRLAHAYLFVGPRGTGKTSTARIFAKALNCPGGPKVDFDPNDPICVEIAEGRSLDVTEIDGASNNSVDDIRALRETVNFAPAVGNFRIYYIDEVHMLSTSAFNALLKTLEEPPPHVKFIFATTEPHKILPTILSRCQRFDLRRIPAPVIAKHLLHIAQEEKVVLDPLAAHAIATGADGGMRDAQSMLDQLVAFCGSEVREEDVLDIFGFTSHRTVSELGGAVLRGETASALSQLYHHAESGKDLSRLLADLIFHFRNLLVHQVDPEIAARDLPPEMAEMLAEQAGLQSTEKLMLLIDQFADAEVSMKWASNKRLYFEIGLIKAAQTLNEVSLSDVVNALRKSMAGESVALPADSLPSFAPPAKAAASTASPAKSSGATAAAPARGSMSDQLRAELGAPAATRSQPAKTASPAAAPSSPPAPSESTVSATAPEPAPQPRSGKSSGDRVESDTLLETAKPAPKAVAEAAPAPTVTPPASPSLDGEALWQAACQEFRVKFPLQAGYTSEMHFLSADARQLLLGVPQEHRAAAQSLERPVPRGALEEILTRLSGRRLQLKIEVRADLQPFEPLPSTEAESQSPPPSLTASAPPKAAAAPPPASVEPETPVLDEKEFQNDPLIREALKLFEARVTKKG